MEWLIDKKLFTERQNLWPKEFIGLTCSQFARTWNHITSHGKVMKYNVQVSVWTLAELFCQLMAALSKCVTFTCDNWSSVDLADGWREKAGSACRHACVRSNDMQCTSLPGLFSKLEVLYCNQLHLENLFFWCMHFCGLWYHWHSCMILQVNHHCTVCCGIKKHLGSQCCKWSTVVVMNGKLTKIILAPGMLHLHYVLFLISRGLHK